MTRDLNLLISSMIKKVGSYIPTNFLIYTFYDVYWRQARIKAIRKTISVTMMT